MPSGTIYGHKGLEHWTVTYRVTIIGDDSDAAVAGAVQFETEMRTLNVDRPSYLQLEDGRWAMLYLPVQPDGDTFQIGPGSHLIPAPSWAPKKGA